MTTATMTRRWPELTDPAILQHPQRLAIYATSRQKGNSHRFAEMCALRQPPGARYTNRAFMYGRQHADQFAGSPATERLGREIRAEAHAHGVPTAGKYYMHSVASYSGDPKGWVADQDEYHDRLKERELAAAQYLDTLEKDQPYRVADDIVEDNYQAAVAANPGIAETAAEQADLKEKIRDQLTPDY